MKVRFKKDYEHTIKTFKKGDIVNLFPSFAKKLLKERVVEKTTKITNEEIVLKKIGEIDDGN